MIQKEILEKLYFKDKLSMMDISSRLCCSPNKIEYWMKKHNFKRRSISEAIYRKCNPNGDPFTLKIIKSAKEAKLMGMGLGLYWGEGNKANKHSLRLGNTDTGLLNMFILY